MKSFFTSTEIARLCGMSVPTILRRFREGILKGFRTGVNSGELRVPRENLIKFLERLSIPRDHLERFEADHATARILFTGESLTMVGGLSVGFQRDSRITSRTSSFSIGRDDLKTFKADMVVVCARAKDRKVERSISSIRNGGNGHGPRIVALLGGVTRARRLKLLAAGAEGVFDAESEKDELKAHVYRVLGLERRKGARSLVSGGADIRD